MIAKAKVVVLPLLVLAIGLVYGSTFFDDEEVVLVPSAVTTPEVSLPALPLRDEPISASVPAEGVGQDLTDRSETGAALAAVRFLELTEDVVGMSPSDGADLQRSISTSEAGPVLAAGTAETLRVLQVEVPDGIAVHVAPIAVSAAEQFDQWVVSIWYIEVLVYGDQLAIEQWRTATYTLVWEETEWRMSGLESVDGPVPVRQAGTTATPIGQLIDRVADLDDEVLVR